MSSTAPVTYGGYCGTHGVYYGMRCPYCTTGVPHQASPPLGTQPAPELTLMRIALALERIAEALANPRHTVREEPRSPFTVSVEEDD
jgi:hypothetical protein